MNAQNTNQAIQSVSNDRFSNSYVNASSEAANDKQYEISASGQYSVSEILRETIKVTRTSLKDLCQEHGFYLAEIEMALRGGRISREMALKLESAFGSPALFWV